MHVCCIFVLFVVCCLFVCCDVADPGAKAVIRNLLDKISIETLWVWCGSDGPVEIMRDSWIPKLKKGEVCLDPSMDYEDTPIVPYEKSSEWCKDF